MGREAQVVRTTKETDVRMSLRLEGTGEGQISTSVPFFDHMLTLFSRHGFFDLTVTAKGDTDVDYHHVVEDVGICLGEAFALELVEEFLRAFSQSSGACVHVNVPYGSNAHHTVEAIFKGLGRAMSDAVRIDSRVKGVHSSKGVLG